MFDKMKKTVFPVVMVGLILALTLGTVVFAAGDFSIGGGDGSSYGLILEKKIGSDNKEETAQDKNYSFWISGESIQYGTHQKWVNGIVTVTGPKKETVYIDGCDSHVIVAEIRNDLTVKQLKNATALAKPELKTVILYDDILEIKGPKLIKNGDQWVEDLTDMHIQTSKVPAVQDVPELQGKYMVINGNPLIVDEDGDITGIGDAVELAVWTADIDATELSIDRNGIIPADKNRFYLTPTGDSVTFISDEIGRGDDREYVFHIDGKGEGEGTPISRSVKLKAGESVTLRNLPHDGYLVTEEPGFSIGEGQGDLEPRPVEVHVGPFSELTITKSKTFDSSTSNALKLVIRKTDEEATFVTEAVFQPRKNDTTASPDEGNVTDANAVTLDGENGGLGETGAQLNDETENSDGQESPEDIIAYLDEAISEPAIPQEVTVTGLTAGELYRVVDYEHGGFTVSYVNQLPMEVIARTEGNGMPVMVFTNTYDKKIGSLLLSKTVKDVKEDAPEEFTFTITLQDADGNNFADGEYLYTGGSVVEGVAPAADGMIKFENGSGTVTLKHGQSILIDGLLEGTCYTVSETMEQIDGEDAFKTVKINGKKVAASDGVVSTGEKVIASGENKVAFLNQNGGYDGPIGDKEDKTVDLVISKTVVDPENDDDIIIDDDDFIIIDDFFFDDDIIIEDDDFFGDDDIIIEDEEAEFTFTLTIKDANGKALKNDQLYVGGSSIDWVEPAESGYLSSGSGTFTLKHGQFITVRGLPVGGTYEVEEVATEDYPTAEINGKWVDAEDGVFSSGVCELSPKDNEVAFTNYKAVEIEDPDVPLVGLPKDELTITKTVKGAKEGDVEEFTFTVILKDAKGMDLVGFFEVQGGSVAEGVEPAEDDFVFLVGSYDFTLKDGQSVTLKDVPISTVYEVKETVTPDFPVVKVDDETVSAVDGVVSSGEGEIGKGGNVVAFTNQSSSVKDDIKEEEPKEDDPKKEDPTGENPKDNKPGEDPKKDGTSDGDYDSEDNRGVKGNNGGDSRLDEFDEQDGRVGGSKVKDTDIPKTGDSSQMSLWAMACVASFAAIVLLLWLRRKHLHKPSL